MKISQSIEAWISDVCAGKSNETASAYRSKLRYLEREVGDIDVSDFSADDFRNFIQALQTRKHKRRGTSTIASPLSKATIHTVATTVGAYLRWAHGHGHIKVDATVDVKIPPLPQPTPKAISQEAVVKMLRAAATTGPKWERYRNVALLYVLRDTGGRVGGMVGMEVDDIDFSALRIRVTEKGGKQRMLHILATTADVLRLWLDVRMTLQPLDNRVFTSSKTLCGLSRGGIYSTLKRLAKKGNVTGRFNPHAFRHAFARDALSNGADISRLAKLLGHTSPYVTLLYYALWYDHEIHEFHRQYSPAGDLPPIVDLDGDAEFAL